MLEPERVEFEAELAALRDVLEPSELERLRDEGRSLPIDGAVALAVSDGAAT